MTQIQIEYYIKTCEVGNIAQAADALFVSRSAVSRAISDLEREFQAELLVRSKNGVTPTLAGCIVYEMVRNFSGSYREVMRRVQELQDATISRQVKVGVTPTNSMQIYRSYLREYFRDNPQKELILTEAAASSCLEQLSQGTIDVAFVPKNSSEKAPFFSALPLYQNRLVLWVRRDSSFAQKSSLEIHDILDCPLGYLLAPMPQEKLLKSCFESYGKQPVITVRTSSVPLLRQLVIDGQACAIVTDDMFEPGPELTAVPLNFFKSSTNYIMWNKNIPLRSAVKDFIESISEKSSR